MINKGDRDDYDVDVDDVDLAAAIDFLWSCLLLDLIRFDSVYYEDINKRRVITMMIMIMT